jgi:hypothetical protein
MECAMTGYERMGLSCSSETNELSIDLAEPRTIFIRGVNEKTQERKDYVLRVTQSGKLVLQ